MRRIEQPLLLRLDDAKEALLAHMRDRTRELRHHIALATEQIRGANPRVLKRGYSGTRRRNRRGSANATDHHAGPSPGHTTGNGYHQCPGGGMHQ